MSGARKISASVGSRAGIEVAAVAWASLGDASLLPPQMIQFQAALTHFWRGLDAILRGGATPEEAMFRAQRLAAMIPPQNDVSETNSCSATRCR